ncbi:MAG: hypothetical protein OK442_08560 [Thaumarchaeota archaeon]|nr:hypothetical protein [Nitrososphaerota archaeon]
MKPIQSSRTEVEVDPAQAALAGRLARDLVDCDSSILSLIVVDSMGRVLHVGRSARLSESELVSPELVRVFGTVSKLIVGAANNATPVMGGTEAIVGIFKKQKALLINLPEYNLLLALRLIRSANAEYICDKIGDLLATRAEP